MNLQLRNHLGHEVEMDVDEFADWARAQAFVRMYDAADIARNNVMAPLDWSVSTLLQAPIRRYAPLSDLVKDSEMLWRRCNESLVDLGDDLPLSAADALSKRDLVQACFQAFMAPTGIGSSIAAKLLHKKRPQLIPVVDSRVARFLVGPGRPQTAQDVTDTIFDHFRPLLCCNARALEYAARRLGDLHLTPCRLLDMVIWRHVDESARSDLA